MKKLLFLVCVFCVNFSSFSQFGELRRSIYFDTDKSALRNDAKNTLDELADSIEMLDLVKIIATGNTDDEGDSIYNLRLSERRTESIVQYFSQKGIDKNLVEKDYYGERKPIALNQTATGKQQNRRVDITIIYRLEEEEDIPVFTSQCKEDTTVTMPNGTQLVFNKCEYLEVYQCLDFKEVATADEALRQGVSTVDGQDNLLASCGMFFFGMKEGCDQKCFKKPVTLRLPAPSSTKCLLCGDAPNLFLMNGIGTWDVTRQKLKLVETKGVKYYQYKVKCTGGKINCDCRVAGYSTKIKMRMKYRLVSISFSSDCPLAAYTYDKFPKNKKRIKKVSIPGFMGDGNVQAVVVDRKGDTLLLTNRPLKSLIKGIKVPFKKQGIYQKYRIQKKDLVKQEKEIVKPEEQ